MSSPRVIIYSNTIIPSKSVIGFLDGSEMFTVCNKYFTDKCGLYDPNKDDISKIATETSAGCRLKSPRVAVKPEGRTAFTNWFVIGWRDSNSSTKDYYISSPTSERFGDKPNDLFKNCHFKLIVTPSGASKDLKPEDINLTILDYQFTIIMEVLLVAELFGINLKEFSGMYDNTEFFTKFAAAIMTSLRDKYGYKDKEKDEPLRISDEYIRSYTNTPLFRNAKGENVIILLREDKENDSSSFEMLCAELMDFIKSKKIVMPASSLYKKIMKKNSVPAPTFKQSVWTDTKNPEITKQGFDSRLDFCIQYEEGQPGFNPNIKSHMITKKHKTKTEIVPMKKDIVELWGGTEASPKPLNNRSVAHRGSIYITPSFDFKFYGAGQPGPNWHVNKIALKKQTLVTPDYFDGGDFMNDSDDEDGIGSTKTFEAEDIQYDL